MAYLDPTAIRLSESFLLSDFMGCDSIYRRGLRNRIADTRDDAQKIREGSYLAEALEEVQKLLGPLSITYGLISDGVSRKIVTYQDPTKPSYHRWDYGAAADFCAHLQVMRQTDRPPILQASLIEAEGIPYSRMITYSESPIICFGTRLEEATGKPRKALYENRLIAGERKPQFITYPQDREKRLRALSGIPADIPWRGQGWPSYHGGGRKQFEHRRVSTYTLLSDFLYDRKFVHEGRRNLPPISKREGAESFEDSLHYAGNVVDVIVSELECRVSIISAYRRGDEDWERGGFSLEIVPPGHYHIDDLADVSRDISPDLTVRVNRRRSKIHSVTIKGR